MLFRSTHKPYSFSYCSIAENNITNQMIDTVESRVSIIDDYAASAEEYMTAFALASEVRDLLANPNDPGLPLS